MCDGVEELIREQGQFRGFQPRELEDVNDLVRCDCIARVNRRFKDKPGGLIVDYIGLFTSLQQALGVYSPSDREQTGVPIQELIDVMLEKHDVVRGMLHGITFDSSPDLAVRSGSDST